PGLQGFRPAVLSLTENYGNQWANVMPDMKGGRLIPTGEIIVPSIDIVNMAKYLVVANNTLTNPAQLQVLNNGYSQLDWFGRTWKFIPDVTIPTGTCYPLFNAKVGRSYDKPGFSGEAVETNTLENWERRKQARAYGSYIISQHRPRAIRIKYIT